MTKTNHLFSFFIEKIYLQLDNNTSKNIIQNRIGESMQRLKNIFRELIEDETDLKNLEVDRNEVN